MGLTGKILLVAIPLGVTVVALAAFQKQIRNAFFTAGQTAGQAITGTFEGFLEPFSKIQFPTLGGTPTQTGPIVTLTPAEILKKTRPEDTSLNNNGAGTLPPGSKGGPAYGGPTIFDYPGLEKRPKVNVESPGFDWSSFWQNAREIFENPQGVLLPGFPVGPGILVPAFGETEKKAYGQGTTAQTTLPKKVITTTSGSFNPGKIKVSKGGKLSQVAYRAWYDPRNRIRFEEVTKPLPRGRTYIQTAAGLRLKETA